MRCATSSEKQFPETAAIIAAPHAHALDADGGAANATKTTGLLRAAPTWTCSSAAQPPPPIAKHRNRNINPKCTTVLWFQFLDVPRDEAVTFTDFCAVC
jgi:hypothetical protein